MTLSFLIGWAAVFAIAACAWADARLFFLRKQSSGVRRWPRAVSPSYFWTMSSLWMWRLEKFRRAVLN